MNLDVRKYIKKLHDEIVHVHKSSIAKYIFEYSVLNISPKKRNDLVAFLINISKSCGEKREYIREKYYSKKSESFITLKHRDLNYCLKEYSEINNIKPPIQLFNEYCRDENGVTVRCGYFLACADHHATISHCSVNEIPLSEAMPDQRPTEFRHRLKEQTLHLLNDKLHQQNDYCSLELQIGVPDSNNLYASPADHSRSWTDYDLEDLLKPQGIYILSGEAGCGKTTFLLKQQLELINKVDLIPIYLRADSVIPLIKDAGTYEGFIKKLGAYFQGYFKDKDETSFLLEYQDKLVFLIDGLDQIDAYGTAYKHLSDKLITLLGNRLIIASRPFAVMHLEQDSQVTFLRLKPFNHTAIEQYFGDHYTHAASLCRQCSHVLSVPMLAYMVRLLIHKKNIQYISNRTELYKYFMDHIFDPHHHDGLKAGHSQSQRIRKDCEKLAYEAIAQDKPFLQVIPFEFLHNAVQSDVDDLFKYGLINLIANRDKGIDKYVHFTHLSFQEYLAAIHISNDDALIKKVLKEKWNLKWKEVLKFLTGIKGSDVVERILAEKDNFIFSKLYLASELVAETKCDSTIKDCIIERLEFPLQHPLYRFDAEEALIRIQQDDAIEPLIEKLSKSMIWGGRTAYNILERNGEYITDKGIGMLIDTLENPDIAKVESSLRLLGQVSHRIDNAALRKIAPKIYDTNLNVAEIAIMLIGKCSHAVDSEIAEMVFHRSKSCPMELGKAIRETLHKIRCYLEGDNRATAEKEHSISSDTPVAPALNKQPLNDKSNLSYKKAEKLLEDSERAYSALTYFSKTSELLNKNTVYKILNLSHTSNEYLVRSALECLKSANIPEALQRHVVQHVIKRIGESGKYEANIAGLLDTYRECIEDRDIKSVLEQKDSPYYFSLLQNLYHDGRLDVIT